MTNDKEQLARNATNTTKRGQQRDDANHHEQFNQREARGDALQGPVSTMLSAFTSTSLFGFW